MSYDITQGDIIAWAEQYDGPLFHALLCDPPYHLTSITERFGKSGAAPAQFGRDGAFARASRGFMGKDWDGGDIAFRPETWATLGRVLHPGAFGMAFASTRGFHRMAVAIEDAGFIIHPVIMAWAFGCLSEDTEILTANGWEPYHKAIVNTPVLCYNMASGRLEWHRVQEQMVYEYDETAYHIRSETTDQIVSRNHRCIVERDGRWAFEYAERLGAVERVPTLSETTVQEAQAQRSRAQGTDHHLSDLRRTSLQAAGVAQKGARRADVRQRLSGRGALTQYRDTRTPETDQRHGAGRLDRREPRVLSAEYERRAQSGLEGRRNLLQDARQLYGREVCSMPAGVHRHGAPGWVRDGASAVRGASDRPAAAALRSGTPQGSQPREQCAGQSATVRHEQRPQALRAPWGASPDLATVTPVHYRGKVWCVRVPTGAFVARRNGLIFITGNSGFPKATRLDTQIDRSAGAEPVVVGQKKHAPKWAAAELGYREKDNGYNSKSRETFDLTAPATELAQAFAGHRYGLQALKPALEPIIVFQKPYQGRPVECITRTGAGALNIDGARIGSGGQLKWAEPRDMGYHGGSDAGKVEALESALGRWPANLALAHHPACNGHCVEACPVRRLGEQSGERSAGERPARSNEQREIYGTYAGRPERERIELDAGTAARFFYNADWMAERLEAADALVYEAKASTGEREAGLEGFTPTTVDDGRAKSIDNAYLRGETQRRNIHPTVKPISLARHLATLLLPPAEYAERRLFIPFAGVASEMIGAMLAGWEHVQGVELDAQHIEIARARLAYWQQRRWELMNPASDITVKAAPDAPDGQLTLF